MVNLCKIFSKGVSKMENEKFFMLPGYDYFLLKISDDATIKIRIK